MSDGRPPPLASVLAIPGAPRVLAHLRRARVDCGMSIAISTGIPLEEVESELERLVGMGLMEASRSRIMKRHERRAKPKAETRVHHGYTISSATPGTRCSGGWAIVKALSAIRP